MDATARRVFWNNFRNYRAKAKGMTKAERRKIAPALRMGLLGGFFLVMTAIELAAIGRTLPECFGEGK